MKTGSLHIFLKFLLLNFNIHLIPYEPICGKMLFIFNLVIKSEGTAK